MSDVSPLSGISGLSFDSTLLPPLLFFCQLLLLFLFCLLLFFFFFFSYWPILLTFYQKILQFCLFGKRIFGRAMVWLLFNISPDKIPSG